MKYSRVWVCALLCWISIVNSQNQHSTYVDDQGVLRYSNDKSEIHAFGINYSTPFAHAWRMAERMDISHREAILQDIYHFARLDLDLYRVHVWDTEISDTLGNLLSNEHLDLFDFAISEMKKRGMKFVITPIAYWGNGWPEPDLPTPGFSARYGKEGSLVHPQAIRAQENYLYQFLNHVNPHTGIAYKDDPDIIAFEVSNEPHHKGTHEEVKSFINRMIAAMRRTGTHTPVFYNVTHSIHLYRAYMESDAQGGTFQWYPAGLVAGQQLRGNYLPHVNEYHIPFKDDPDFQKMAKLVYEFDAADVAGNYMYPAMARSFRSAGMQIAAQFDYDAMFLAPYNTNYGTHYMSLPYAPQKALSLKIASAVFHEIPRYGAYGGFPANTRFGNFRIDYENDLAELVSDRRFFYSNSTASSPADVGALREIAGYGNSPLVQYDGKGAYFLDRLEEGLWRLEVMPDAHWLGDPYARSSPGRQVAAVHHRLRSVRIHLPDLGRDFAVNAINEGNNHQAKAVDGGFEVMPGAYILQTHRNRTGVSSDRIYRNIRISEYVAPPSDLNITLVKNQTPLESTAGKPVSIRFEVISKERPSRVMVTMFGVRGNREVETRYKGADVYEAEVPAELSAHGLINYYIVLEQEKGTITFPAGVPGKPFDWDFHNRTPYSIAFIPADERIILWEASAHHQQTLMPWARGVNFRPSAGNSNGLLFYELDKVPFSQDGTDSSYVHTFKHYFRHRVTGRFDDMSQKQYLVIRGKSITEEGVLLEIALIDKNANVYSTQLLMVSDEYLIPLKNLTPGRFAIVPRPYPEFKPWYAATENHAAFRIQDLETVQVTLLDNKYESILRFYLEEIALE
jgi:hypothetical protein